MSSDEFDAYADEYDGLDFAAIPDLNDDSPPVAIPASVPARPASAGSASSHYSFDDLDPSILDEVAAIEGRMTQGTTGSTTGTDSPISHVNRSAHTRAAPPPQGRVGVAVGTRARNNAKLIHAPGDAIPSAFNLYNNGVPTNHQLSLSRACLIRVVLRGTKAGPFEHRHVAWADRMLISEVLRPQTPTRATQCSVEDFPPKVPSKRGHTETSPIESPSNSKKKGKGKSPGDASNEFEHILEGLEDEMTCPICCDIFVMPSLSFSPVVGERVVVCVGPESQPSCVQTIHFTASFPSQQAYDEYRRDRVRVELWTNVPTAENKSGGQGWVALPFRERDAITPEDSGAFALLPETPSVKTLHLEIPVPRSGNSFSFTHRLSYPSGEIRWLGQYRRDGQLIIERSDPRFTRGTFINKDGESLVSGVNGWVDKEIGQLSKTFDWSIHAIQDDGYDAEMKGEIRLAAVRRALSYGGAPRGQLLNFDASASHAILAAPAGSSPTTVSVVPIITPVPSSSSRSIRVSTQSLAALVPRDITDLSLFCPSTLGSRFVAVPSDAKLDEHVALQASSECAQFLLAPAYNLGTGAWKVSLTTSHTRFTAAVSQLPSPPSSPVTARLSLSKDAVHAVPVKEVVIDEVEGKNDASDSAPESSPPPSALSIPFIPSIIVLQLWLVKLWLFRLLMHLGAHRLPQKEVHAYIKAHVEEPEAHEHEDEDEADDETVAPSVSSAADVGTVAYLDDDLKSSVSGVSELLFDVGAGDVALLVRSAVASASASTDTLKIDLDGMPVKRTVRALDDGIFLFEFSAGTAGGRLSVQLA
ncbi:hypothetical protein HWV62_30433 [Athelia sp. TMB]|nr:hypothetical protein HWV62_30433 [Athelia sp. TMB]